jgi:hypothetical protein
VAVIPALGKEALGKEIAGRRCDKRTPPQALLQKQKLFKTLFAATPEANGVTFGDKWRFIRSAIWRARCSP